MRDNASSQPASSYNDLDTGQYRHAHPYLARAGILRCMREPLANVVPRLE